MLLENDRIARLEGRIAELERQVTELKEDALRAGWEIEGMQWPLQQATDTIETLEAAFNEFLRHNRCQQCEAIHARCPLSPARVELGGPAPSADGRSDG